MRRAFVNNVVYPLMERLKGNKIRCYLRQLHESEKLSREELQAFQLSKLKDLLIYCIHNVPAYAAFKGLLPVIEEDPYQALNEFPLLTKEHFIQYSTQYFSREIDRSQLICNRTGGSTGQPVKFYLDRKTVEYYEAARWRGLSWWGIEPGDPSVMIWGSPLELSKSQSRIYKLKERLLKNRIMLPAYGLDPRELSRYVRLIDSFAPDYLYGYASALYAFASLLGSRKLGIERRLKGIVSTAETLFEDQRLVIERFLGAPVINEYGARDAGIIAYECPAGSMHLAMENLIVEIIDLKTGERVDDGKSGLVVVTDLNNYSMPRLRYLLGDLAALSSKQCQCGRELRTLQAIEGREDDMFVSKDGKVVHGHYWNHIARNLKGLKQFQLIQHDPENVTLKLVRNKSFLLSEEEQFIDQIKGVLGMVKINVIYCDAIEPSPSGKVRYARREFSIS